MMKTMRRLERRGGEPASRYPHQDPGDLATGHAYMELMDRIRADVMHQRAYPLDGPVRRAMDLAGAIMPGRDRRWRRAMLAAALLAMGTGRRP